ncbi:PAF15 factor, partial [Penelope pileata]|nr:PAF15 factor [Penelope pileata]
MARTKASSGGAYRKVLAGRAPRKVLGSGSLNAGARCSPRLRPGQRGAGNAVCVRPVPGWQRGIGEFLRPQQENRDPGGEAAGGSGLGRPGRER